jgi:ADP-ribose pyrophosphatase YjhB (NUDIX family)
VVEGERWQGGALSGAAGRYRRRARRLVCSNQVFEVYFDEIRTPAGELIRDFLIVKPKVAAARGIAGVCVLPERNGRIGLMRGWRHHLGKALWQAPAGFMERGEGVRETALRELREETGLECRPRDLQSLGVYYPDAALIEGAVAMFVARRCRPAAGGRGAAEVGTGRLRFFTRPALKRLLLATTHSGGSTLVACARLLLREARA